MRAIEASAMPIPRPSTFHPAGQQPLAYVDRDLAVTNPGDGRPPRYLLKPAVLARLIQEAAIGASDRVLDVGCATGYSSAVLSKLAGTIVALEEDRKLAEIARDTLAAICAHNVAVETGALTAGAPGKAPFDVILLNGAAEILPNSLS